jgi:hypothetical protein
MQLNVTAGNNWQKRRCHVELETAHVEKAGPSVM